MTLTLMGKQKGGDAVSAASNQGCGGWWVKLPGLDGAATPVLALQVPLCAWVGAAVPNPACM